MEKPKVYINNQLCLLEQIYVSELGFTMVKVLNIEKKVYQRFNCGLHNLENNFINDLINKECKK